MTFLRLLRTLFLPLLLCLPLLNPATAKARVYLDITAANLRKVPFAVPAFVGKDKPGEIVPGGKELADILGRSLAFHGFIEIVPPIAYQGNHRADWRQVGVDYAVLGSIDIHRDTTILELRLIDAAKGRMALGRRYKGPQDKQQLMVRKFCDEIIEKLTGEAGVSLSKIAFVSDNSGHKEIYVSDILGDEVHQVTSHSKLAVSPRFSPDGLKLAYTSYHRGNPNLYVTNLAQSTTTQAISRRKGLNMAPAWSPDGKTMAVTLSVDGNPDLYLLDNTGKILERLTIDAGINVSPSWAPDGRQLAFVSDRSGKPQIYVMDVPSKRVRRITFNGNDNTAPSWSPKDDLIAYAGLEGSEYHIFTIDPQGGRATRITSYWGDHESPSWSPDGRQIVFSRRRNNNQELCSIFKNGTGQKTLFGISGNQSFPQWSPRLKL